MVDGIAEAGSDLRRSKAVGYGDAVEPDGPGDGIRMCFRTLELRCIKPPARGVICVGSGQHTLDPVLVGHDGFVKGEAASRRDASGEDCGRAVLGKDEKWAKVEAQASGADSGGDGRTRLAREQTAMAAAEARIFDQLARSDGLAEAPTLRAFASGHGLRGRGRCQQDCCKERCEG